VLQPAETADIEAKFSTGSLRGPQSRRVIVIYQRANDDKAHALQIALQANIAPDYDFHPESLTFRNDANEQRFVLTARLLPGINVTEAYTTHRAFEVTAFRTLDHGKSWHVTVAFRPDESSHEIPTADLILHTNSAGQPLCRIPLGVSMFPVTSSPVISRGG
jgi:hypothetical protein